MKAKVICSVELIIEVEGVWADNCELSQIKKQGEHKAKQLFATAVNTTEGLFIKSALKVDSVNLEVDG